MSRQRLRAALAVPVVAGLGALLVWAVVGLPDFGHYRGPYGNVLNRVAVPERHTTNVVAATVFDYRGLDTLGEEFILFAAVAGVVLLLREPKVKKEAEKEVADEVTSDALKWVGLLMVGVSLVVGIWLVAFGYVTPGGGFQGGVVIAGALLLVYAAHSNRTWIRVSHEEVLDPIGAFGAGGYAVVGIAALASGLPFLHNLLGPGQTGTLMSGGSIQFLNVATALEVFAANLLLCAEFLEQYIVPLARERQEQ